LGPFIAEIILKFEAERFGWNRMLSFAFAPDHEHMEIRIGQESIDQCAGFTTCDFF